MAAADQNEVAANILVPADLPGIEYDLAIQAELLAADNKTVVASAVATARRMRAVTPIALELASQTPVRLGRDLDPPGKLVGKINRFAGFAQPINLTLTGLPKGMASPALAVPGDKSDFEFPITFPYATPAGDLANVKLVATSQLDAKNPNTIGASGELAVAIKVVGGEKPPTEKPLTIFEDNAEFVTQLAEGRPGGAVER